jgi:hypothetical protein
MEDSLTIWSITIEPDYQCEWYVGEVWVALAGHQWREDTVVDVDYSNFERRLEEQVTIIKTLFKNGEHDSLYS